MDSARADPKVEPPFDVSFPDDAGRKQFWSITQFSILLAFFNQGTHVGVLVS